MNSPKTIFFIYSNFDQTPDKKTVNNLYKILKRKRKGKPFKIILLSAEMRQERLREELYGIPLSREQEKRETAELTSYYYSLPPRERHLFFYLMKETMYFVLKEREI